MIVSPTIYSHFTCIGSLATCNVSLLLDVDYYISLLSLSDCMRWLIGYETGRYTYITINLRSDVLPGFPIFSVPLFLTKLHQETPLHVLPMLLFLFCLRCFQRLALGDTSVSRPVQKVPLLCFLILLSSYFSLFLQLFHFHLFLFQFLHFTVLFLFLLQF